MKLATLRAQNRDGELVVVSQDLTQAVKVLDIAKTLQEALDHWQTVYPALHAIYDSLNNHKIAAAFAFDPKNVMAPLPRAYQWLDASAYVNHVELVRKSRGVEMPASFWTDPLMYQGGSDNFLGPHDDILLADESWGIDFEAEVAVITTDVPMGVSPQAAEQCIALIVLVNDISLRHLALPELKKGFGFVQSKPSSSMSPVAITPHELGKYWDGKKVYLPIVSHLRGKWFGHPNAGIDMTFDFPTLIAHAAKTRSLSSGTIIGSGTISNRDRSLGSSCIVEKRTLEFIESGAPQTPFMHFGDRIRIEMFDEHRHSLFGAIDQVVTRYA